MCYKLIFSCQNGFFFFLICQRIHFFSTYSFFKASILMFFLGLTWLLNAKKLKLTWPSSINRELIQAKASFLCIFLSKCLILKQLPLGLACSCMAQAYCYFLCIRHNKKIQPVIDSNLISNKVLSSCILQELIEIREVRLGRGFQKCLLQLRLHKINC